MIRKALAIAFSLTATSAMAQMTPVGLWKTIDDNDGTAKAEIRIVETAGVLSGKIEKVLDPKASQDAVCEKCTDDRKGRTIVGLEIIRGVKKTDGKEVWEGGTIVDSTSGTIYKTRMTPIDGGKKLEMRGYVGAPLFGRTQTWIRIQ